MRNVGTRTVVLLMLMATALVGTGVVLGVYFESPEEAALRLPPTVATITDRLRSEVLEDSITFRGAFVPASRAALRLASSLEGKVVTAVLLQPESDLQFGEAVIEVEGRPVIVLGGELPAWRDFHPGMTPGPDVEQLQTALAHLGFYKGRVNGEFTTQTLNASRSLYRATGYRAPAGRMIPQQELVFASSANRRVSSVAIVAGDLLAGGAVELSGSRYRIDADLSADARASLVRGTRIELASVGGSTWASAVEAVLNIGTSDAPGQANTGILVADPVPAALAGDRAFRAVLSSTTQPVLSAAAAAVHESSSGDPYVVRLEAGSERYISVVVGLVTGTRIEIRVRAPATLAAGDLLVLNPSP